MNTLFYCLIGIVLLALVAALLMEGLENDWDD